MSSLNLTKEIKEHASKMRELRNSQKWVSSQEAYDQCRRVEMMASLSEDSAPNNASKTKARDTKQDEETKPPN